MERPRNSWLIRVQLSIESLNVVKYQEGKKLNYYSTMDKLSSYLRTMQKLNPRRLLFHLKPVICNNILKQKSALKKRSFGFSMELIYLDNHLQSAFFHCGQPGQSFSQSESSRQRKWRNFNQSESSRQPVAKFQPIRELSPLLLLLCLGRRHHDSTVDSRWRLTDECYFKTQIGSRK